MKLGKLSPSKGSVSKTKRLGRGNATGQGRTAGKGHKGQQSRSGAKKKLYFEGGQTPLARRLPKIGMGRGNFNHLTNHKKMIHQMNDDDIVELAYNIKDGIPFATPVFDGASFLDVISKMKEAKIPSSGKVFLYDGRTGEKITSPSRWFSELRSDF